MRGGEEGPERPSLVRRERASVQVRRRVSHRALHDGEHDEPRHLAETRLRDAEEHGQCGGEPTAAGGVDVITSDYDDFERAGPQEKNRERSDDLEPSDVISAPEVAVELSHAARAPGLEPRSVVGDVQETAVDGAPPVPSVVEGFHAGGGAALGLDGGGGEAHLPQTGVGDERKGVARGDDPVVGDESGERDGADGNRKGDGRAVSDGFWFFRRSWEKETGGGRRVARRVLGGDDAGFLGRFARTGRRARR